MLIVIEMKRQRTGRKKEERKGSRNQNFLL